MSNKFQALDEVMRESAPAVYGDLRPGIQTGTGTPMDLKPIRKPIGLKKRTFLELVIHSYSNPRRARHGWATEF